MRLEEAHMYVINDLKRSLRKPDYFNIEQKEEEEFTNLLVSIFLLMEGKEIAQEYIKNNPLVKEFRTKNEDCYIETSFGQGYFFPASKIFGKESTDSFVRDNSCHANSMTAAVILDEIAHDTNPTVLTGVASILDTTFLHSVYSIDLDKGRFIVDYTYNLAMSEDLLKKFYNFKTLNETTVKNMKKMLLLDEKYQKISLEKRGNSTDAIAYFLLSNESMMKYINDVINGEIEDDFPFPTEQDFNESIKNIKKVRNEDRR